MSLISQLIILLLCLKISEQAEECERPSRRPRVNKAGLTLGAELGGSSDYSNEKFEDKVEKFENRT